mmetsp:Transcript_11646/g.17569  ORF Transcript_11646/g.17569 Transcript_11646/m.17569 type:complete len:298 (+) Transcript_11646:64-957(+)
MIIYACVTRNEVLLAEHSTSAMEESFNLVTVTQALLKTFADIPDGQRQSYVYKSTTGSLEPLGANKTGPSWSSIDLESSGRGPMQDFFYHLAKAPNYGVTYVCISDDARELNHNFSFLAELESQFTKKFPKRQILKANAYAMEKKFSAKIGTVVHNYNTHPNASGGTSAAALTEKVEEVKNVVGDSISTVLRRDENVNDVLRSSKLLRRDSLVFKRTSQTVKRKSKNQLRLYNWGVALLIMLGCYSVFAYMCGLEGQVCFEKMKNRSNSASRNDEKSDDGGSNVQYYDGDGVADDFY